jgi:hypothetical protein
MIPALSPHLHENQAITSSTTLPGLSTALIGIFGQQHLYCCSTTNAGVHWMPEHEGNNPPPLAHTELAHAYILHIPDNTPSRSRAHIPAQTSAQQPVPDTPSTTQSPCRVLRVTGGSVSTRPFNSNTCCRSGSCSIGTDWKSHSQLHELCNCRLPVRRRPAHDTIAGHRTPAYLTAPAPRPVSSRRDP